MTLYQIIKHLESIALTSPYIRSTGEGNIYDYMNGNPHIKYGVFHITQGTHRQDEQFDYYSFNLFVIDRLEDDLETNRLHIQSVAKDVLSNTILTFRDKFYGVTTTELQFHPFTQKFVDLCAGQYVTVTFRVPNNLICPDTYVEDYVPNYRLKTLEVELSEDGTYTYEPEQGWDGFDRVIITIKS